MLFVVDNITGVQLIINNKTAFLWGHGPPDLVDVVLQGERQQFVEQAVAAERKIQ